METTVTASQVSVSTLGVDSTIWECNVTRHLFLLNEMDRLMMCIELSTELLVGVLGQVRWRSADSDQGHRSCSCSYSTIWDRDETRYLFLLNRVDCLVQSIKSPTELLAG